MSDLISVTFIGEGGQGKLAEIQGGCAQTFLPCVPRIGEKVKLEGIRGTDNGYGPFLLFEVVDVEWQFGADPRSEVTRGEVRRQENYGWASFHAAVKLRPLQA